MPDTLLLVFLQSIIIMAEYDFEMIISRQHLALLLRYLDSKPRVLKASPPCLLILLMVLVDKMWPKIEEAVVGVSQSLQQTLVTGVP